MRGLMIFLNFQHHKKIPSDIHITLLRKLDIINAATT